MNLKDLLKALKGNDQHEKLTKVMNALVDRTIAIGEEIYDDLFEEDDKRERRNFMMNFAVNLYGNIIKKYSPNDKKKFLANMKLMQETLDEWTETTAKYIEKGKCTNPDCDNHD